MGAYNLLNGEHCCTSKSLLNQVLRKEWGFDGTIISDWGGVHDTALAAESALDIEMDVTYTFDEQNMAMPLLEKVRSGEISEQLVDEKVRNILRMMLRLHMIGETGRARKSGSYNTPEHREAVLDVAREAIVLLKNDDAILPLHVNEQTKIAVIGQNAAAVHSNGGGSAEIKALYEISPLMGIKKLLGGNAKVSYAPGYYIPGKENTSEVNWQADSTKHLDEAEEKETQQDGKNRQIEEAVRQQEYRKEALALAAASDTVIFIGGLNHDYDVEGQDRADMKLPYGQDELITELLKINEKTVVVLYAGSPVEMPWKDKAKAILWSYYAGMEGGTAIAETLFGCINPSGKLAETFIRDVAQCPAHHIGTFGKKDVVEYKEGVMVGYRYYDTEDTEVNFCFGHGLSYSEFEYRDMKVTPVAAWQADSVGEGCLSSVRYQVSFIVKNIGNCTAKEVVQLYVAPKTSKVIRPYHELRDFEKIELQPKQEQRVTLMLTERAFAYYDEKAAEFVTEAGTYEIQIGASSRDIRLRQEVEV